MKYYWPELDILRAIAVILMIINHTGFAFIPTTEQATTWAPILFATSFAPVLFFFTTGFGVALSSNNTGEHRIRVDTLFKGCALVLADFFMRDISFTTIGIDFLAFIGITIIFFEVIKPLRRTTIICIIILSILLIMRYLIGPALTANSNAPSPEFLKFFGINSFSHSSYWFAPWAAYPISGYLLGKLAAKWHVKIEQRKEVVLTGLTITSLIGIVGAITLDHIGLIFFRWGTISLAYFLTGFAAISIAMALSFCAIIYLPKSASKTVSLRGIASLAAVPVHYLIIRLAHQYQIEQIVAQNILLFLVAIIALSYIGSNAINRASIGISRQRHGRVIQQFLLISLGTTSLTFALTDLHPNSGGLWPYILQIGVCLTLQYRIFQQATHSNGK